EYGATCGFFPVDAATIEYLRGTGRDEARIALVEAYTKAQGMWVDRDSAEPVFTDVIELDLSSVLPSIAGPKRPQDRVLLKDAAAVGEDVAGPRQPGGDRVSRPRRADPGPRRARLPARGLWLHDVHRQLRPARGCDRRRDRGQQAGRRLRAVGQPQLRGKGASE